ncbi:DUF5602 domain-containing protein (plasmid) [Deinococcus radiomollis]|uniref:cytochrome C n=1 Tax=Deinococcus radiomollis TaxID=468916 RepID=UPI003892BDE2
MHTTHTVRSSGRSAVSLLLSLCLFSSALTLAQTGPGQLVQGNSGTMFGATVTTWARLAPDGTVLSAGATLPMALIEHAPAMPEGMAPMAGPPAGYVPFAVDFPTAVKATTFLDHVDVGWIAGGHPPVYLVPHFDLHFFTVSAQAVQAIDCKDLSQASPAQLAPHYLPLVPPNAQPAEACRPFMGFHSLPMTDLAPGKKFDKTMLAVYYAGQLNAIEPMITRDTLMKKQSFSLPMPVLAMVGKATRFPTHFEAVFDPASDAYQLTFSAFVKKTR